MMSSDTIVDLYERHAEEFDRDRGRSLQERAWLDRFLTHVPLSGSVLDAGCGMGEPIARYILEAGRQVVGIDSSPSLIRKCRTRFPGGDWIVADMRQLALDRRFDGILAWDSFFHLGVDDQRAMFARFAAHANPGAPLMFTSGPGYGEAIGNVWGEPLYHASLDSTEYRQLLLTNGFSVLSHLIEDPTCGKHTVWLAKFCPSQVHAA
jgi:SAM-dependent methyltransferase